MSNALKSYNPIFFAQEALIWLSKNLGMASRVHRGYEPSPQTRGSTIRINRPMTFTATDMPANNTDLTPDEVEVQLSNWKGVTFSLTDKELSHTKEVIIRDHIAPAANAVADAIDASLCALYKDVPWYFAATATPTDVSDLTALRKILVDNKAPNADRHLMLSTERMAKFLNLTAFSQWQGSGNMGVMTQESGELGGRFGFSSIFENQNVASHDTTAIGSITALQLNANADKGDTSIVIKDSDGTLTGAVIAGDSFVIAGNSQRYAITAAASASGNLLTVSITPPLVQDYSADAGITPLQSDATESVAFHRGAFALAMAPLSDMGNQLGAQIASVNDPVSNLSIRSRMWYDGSNAKVYVGLDALWGVKTLNPNLAVRYRV